MGVEIQAVSGAVFDAEVIEASKTKPVLVDFWATWCRPCANLAPTVQEIADKHAETLKIVKVDVDVETVTAQRFNIRGIPTLILFKGGVRAAPGIG